MLGPFRVGMLVLSLACAPLPVLAQAQDHPAASLPVPQSSLTPQERASAVQLALPQRPVTSLLALRDKSTPNRVVVSNVQATGVGKSDKRLAVVTIYQYADNTTVNRLVDLTAGTVVSEERVANAAAPIAPVEADYAKSLALADERVSQLLAPYHDTATLQFLLTSTADRSSPFFGKRVFGVLVKTPRGYLATGPKIFVDLTDGRVILQ